MNTCIQYTYMYIRMYITHVYIYIHTRCTYRHGRAVVSVPHDDLQSVLFYVPLLESWGELASVKATRYLTAPQDPGACAKAHKEYNGNWFAELDTFYYL